MLPDRLARLCDLSTAALPSLQRSADSVVHRVEHGHLSLVTEVSLGERENRFVIGIELSIRTRNMSIAACLFLSWKLLMYALDTDLVASDTSPVLLHQHTCERVSHRTAPANVRLPVRVKLVLSAPVPA
jgi:hypothetical protein